MLKHGKIDVSEDTDTDKTSGSHECVVIIDTFRINFSFEPKVWDTCHDDTKINEFQ